MPELLVGKATAPNSIDAQTPTVAAIGAALLPDSRDTTQVCVIDAGGNAVAMTHTLGLASGVVTEDLGFMYNNSMMLFGPNPGQPNSIAPGRIRAAAAWRSWSSPSLKLQASK